MKILVLENNPKELALIQQTLNGSKDKFIPIASGDEAWPHIESGEVCFLIANWDTSDLRSTQFITRVRAATLPNPPYILLSSTKNLDDDQAANGMDDSIQRPFKASDLKNRVAIAGRIISLTSNLARARNQLEAQALFDSLTGFMNRAAFLRQSAGELERARRASLPLSLVALNIDNFKIINDKFGIVTGDEVLRIVSQTIREKSRPYDCIGRWTGDEFVIFLGGVIGADAEKVADRIIAGIQGTRIEVENEPSLVVKVSAGIASLAHISASIELEPLIHQARQAVARAKEAGGDQVFLVYL